MLIVRDFPKLSEYKTIEKRMRTFTDSRTEDTPDELWLLEHPPVFTLGQAGKKEHLIHSTEIPLLHTDRGGQVTYHGPGQLVAYTLIDIRRKKLSIRELVSALENAMIQVLKGLNISAHSRCDAPGVYVGPAKIGSLGLRIRKGRSYHGLSLNVAMDTMPFTLINPCGHPGLAITQVRNYLPSTTVTTIKPLLMSALNQTLGYI